MTDEQRKRIHKIVYSCDDRAELAERIVRLEEENAELKKAMDFQALELGCMTDNRDVLYVENAKLREYVQMLAKATVYDPCEWCQYEEDDCPPETEPMREGCRLRSELRELGVEVDE